ncbi:helix-turn-helix domain-containing protein [Gulosibacter molinativorax]|uniref:XRE family transcriptional regulator n=1 Tax=Gulosibacter molinativorax TaxID=256821 RepID=A0ABT7CC18_9MICO|nr:helix-turn-helix transcriptional regulator [Gulosibacter molinativorax]MDJ1372344.1 XRE family transcriptional regulator [Gulosibacter molinativorax]QUY63566.1 Helix-turn-helix protein [Gulosibacter molinativorax]
MPQRAEKWDEYVRTLGLNLQRARSEKAMSQERVASAAEISVFTYRKLEKGESNPGTAANPRLRTLVALAEVLEVPVTELLPPALPGITNGR